MNNEELSLEELIERKKQLENEMRNATAVTGSDADDYFNPLLESCQTANGALYDFLEAYYE